MKVIKHLKLCKIAFKKLKFSNLKTKRRNNNNIHLKILS